MRPSILDLPQSCEDIQALRRAIAQLADHCGIDLDQRAVLRRLLDGDFGDAKTTAGDRRNAQELSAMLTLLFRLEASSSEDLGISGLRRLWRQLGPLLARFPAGQLIAG